MAAIGDENDPTLVQADQLNKDNKFEEVWEFLNGPEIDANSVSIQWRKARACFDMADLNPDDKKWKERWIRQGFDFAKQALASSASNPNFGAHKWYAVLISAMGDFISTKEKIQQSTEIKEHGLKALELKPGDPSTLHLLGRWCYAVSSIGWMERKLASAIFGSPPESSYQEAINYFVEADKGFKWSTNMYYLGLAYEGIGDKAKAKAAFQEGAAIPPQTGRDERFAEMCRKKL